MKDCDGRLLAFGADQDSHVFRGLALSPSLSERAGVALTITPSNRSSHDETFIPGDASPRSHRTRRDIRASPSLSCTSEFSSSRRRSTRVTASLVGRQHARLRRVDRTMDFQPRIRPAPIQSRAQALGPDRLRALRIRPSPRRVNPRPEISDAARLTWIVEGPPDR